MDNKPKVRYCYGNEIAHLDPVHDIGKAKIRELPDRYMIKIPGFYKFGDNIWQIDKEGLYQFPSEEDALNNFCYYEKDTFALASALFHSARFEETTQPVEHVELLDYYLKRRIETNSPIINLLMTFLNGNRIAVRQVALYSPTINNSIFDWLEVWDYKKKCWDLYWLDKAAYLGSVDKNRTSFDVFETLCKEDAAITQIMPHNVLNNDILKNAGVLDEANEALKDHNVFIEMMKKYKVFPVIRSEGKEILKATTKQCYRQNVPPEISSVMVGGDDAVSYDLSFHDDQYIKETVYGPQIYIVTYKAVRIE